MKNFSIRILLAVVCIMIITMAAACGGNEVTNTLPDDSNNTTITAPVINPPSDGDGSNAPVDANYFNDAAFVGDSVSLKLNYYCATTGDLGKAQFFTSGSLGAGNALWEVSDESVHPSYQGEKMLIEDCLAASGASKVYIMLGMNDIGLYGVDDTVANYETLMDRILAKCPDIQIIIQSMTPMTETSNILGDTLNNQSIKEYNGKLKTLAEERGWGFVDVASVMYDESGSQLNAEYCSDPVDMGVHFTEAGCAAWIDYLKTHIV